MINCHTSGFHISQNIISGYLIDTGRNAVRINMYLFLSIFFCGEAFDKLFIHFLQCHSCHTGFFIGGINMNKLFIGPFLIPDTNTFSTLPDICHKLWLFMVHIGDCRTLLGNIPHSITHAHNICSIFFYGKFIALRPCTVMKGIGLFMQSTSAITCHNLNFIFRTEFFCIACNTVNCRYGTINIGYRYALCCFISHSVSYLYTVGSVFRNRKPVG